jgi:hypothetical protein
MATHDKIILLKMAKCAHLPSQHKKLFFETKLTSAGDFVFTLTICIIAS